MGHREGSGDRSDLPQRCLAWTHFLTVKNEMSKYTSPPSYRHTTISSLNFTDKEENTEFPMIMAIIFTF